MLFFLTSQSLTFKKSSKGLARAMWWKNIKITIILVIVIIVSSLLHAFSLWYVASLHN